VENAIESSTALGELPRENPHRDRVPLALGIAPLSVAAFGLAGWWLDLPTWAHWIAPLSPMSPTSAVSLALLGAGIISAERARNACPAGATGPGAPRRVATLAGLLVLAISAATLSTYLSQSSWGTEQVFHFESARRVESTYPGRSSPQTAAALVCLATALLCALWRPPRSRLAQILSLAAGALALVAVAGHIHGVAALFGVGGTRGVGLPTVAGLLSGAGGIIALERDHGIRALLERPGPAGQHARQLAVAALAIPFGGALLLRGGELLGWYNAQLRSAAYVALTALLLCALAWAAAVSMFRSEQEREQLATERSARVVAEAIARNLRAQVAERQRLLGEVRDALRARDQFLSLASHELRTPLTSLKLQSQGLSRALARGPVERERAETSLARIDGQIRRLEQLISNLLDVSRISEGRLRIEPEVVELGALARAVADRFTERFRNAGSVLDLETESVTGRWDPGALDHVLSNLLDNAAKYGSGQPVKVRVEAAGGGARIVVEDHGIGIPEEEREHIFDRFQRAHGARAYGGLGLGLWIARQLVHAMGGVISVTSSPGAGSTFAVDLPLEWRPPAPKDQAVPVLAQPTPAGLSPDLVTGHPDVDAQHAAILDELKRMRHAPAHSVWESLEFLAEHTASHFGFEELLMEQVRDPDRAKHGREHAAFLEELAARRARLEREGATPGNVEALVDSVERWVSGHVMGRDIAMAALVRAKRPVR
jgi:hemerythrin-like metal-binding protein